MQLHNTILNCAVYIIFFPNTHAKLNDIHIKQDTKVSLYAFQKI